MGGGNLTWVAGIIKGVPEPKGSQIINIGPGNSEKEFEFDSQNKRKPGKSLYELLFCGRSLAGKKKNYSVEINKNVFLQRLCSYSVVYIKT